MTRENNQSGFTLLEAIIVIAIIAIVSTIAAPIYKNQIASTQLRHDAQNIYSLLQSAKMLAVKERSDVRVVFDTGATPQQVSILSNGGATITDTLALSNNNIYGHGAATTPIGASFGDGVTFTADTVTFNSRGSANAGYVYIQNNNNQCYAVGVLTTGLVRIRNWVNNGWE